MRIVRPKKIGFQNLEFQLNLAIKDKTRDAFFIHVVLCVFAIESGSNRIFLTYITLQIPAQTEKGNQLVLHTT